MDSARIAELLTPFLTRGGPGATLSPLQLERISIYIDLLLRWNARMNLTAVRSPDEIVTRHFGESLFAARILLPGNAAAAPDSPSRVGTAAPGCPAQLGSLPVPLAGRVIDVGAGAGFPGLPMKIWSPQISVTLIEANHKKVAFLREVIRALTLTTIDVFPGRADAHPPASAALVTLRAVERFNAILPTAIRLLAPGGRLALLISTAQIPTAQLYPLCWSDPHPIPSSEARVLLIGRQLQHSPEASGESNQ
jgi:16S rRNA (guanine527-N7)-methyltransferase